MRLIDIINSPWAIMPDKLQEIQAIYETHLRGEKIDLHGIEARLGRPLNNERQGYDIVGNVAVVPMHGVLAKRMNLFSQISAGASTELIARDIRDAMADPAVESIVLSIDSPGGTVDGTQVLANIVAEAKQTKPVTVLASGVMASAAYWIGAAASKLMIADATTAVGSIGVVATHVDLSQAQQANGVKTTEIYAGKYKRLASNYKPLSDEARAYMQEQVDYLYSIFVNDVAKFRGVSTDTVLVNMADGRIFVGQQAIDAGLVDGVSTLDALIAELQTSTPRVFALGGAGVALDQSTNQESETMDSKITVEHIAANYPDVAEAFRNEGYARGKHDGAEAERTRIKEVEAQALPGHEQLIGALKFDGKTSGPEAAVQILAAEKQKGARMLANIQADAPAPLQPSVEVNEETVDANLPLEERCKKGWDKKPALRAEFGDNFAAYLAFEKAQAEGLARIVSR